MTSAWSRRGADLALPKAELSFLVQDGRPMALRRSPTLPHQVCGLVMGLIAPRFWSSWLRQVAKMAGV
jgi:hypothetical protein